LFSEDVESGMEMDDKQTRRDFIKQAGLTTAGFILGLRASAGRASSARSRNNRPNILFFLPDQHRFDWVGLNPDLPLRTPNIDALAQHGVYFPNAICPSPLCVPSRTCLASGKEYDGCGVRSNGDNYPDEQTTFYTLLRKSGYHVMGCGKFDLRKPAKDWGRDGRHNVDGKCYLELWGFSDGIDNSGKHDGISGYSKGKVCPYFAYLEEKGLAKVHFDDFSKRSYPNFDNTEPTPLPEEAYADNWIAANGLKLIERAPKDRPWFLQVNFNGPHEPMDVTKRMKDRWRGINFPQPFECKDFTPAKHVEIRRCYAAMIENIDRWLGIYIEQLKKTGELDNTLIVYSSDHGEMLGDHNRWNKSVPYKQSAGVPLVVAGPGVSEGHKFEGLVTTLDLTATFLDYAGLAVPSDMDSRSMRPLLQGSSKVHREFVRSGLGPWRMVFDGRYKLIRGFDPTQKYVRAKDAELTEPVVLFDLREDPMETTDISQKLPDVVERLMKVMKSAK
jgi:arylsulfatase A-like enzyme